MSQQREAIDTYLLRVLHTLLMERSVTHAVKTDSRGLNPQRRFMSGILQPGHQHLRGELTIGLTDNLVTLPHMRITHALAQLKERGPDVQIQIRMIAPT